MEKRRIQLVGRSTLTVSLPTSWVKRVGLKKGDLVTIIPQRDGSIRITENYKSSKIEADVYIINSDHYQGKGLIGRVIMASYSRGYDKIKIVSSKRIHGENLKEIRDAEFKLMGLSIVEETPSSIMLQCSLNPTDFQIDVMIRRLNTLFTIMCDDAIQALITSKMEFAEDAKRRELQVNRIYALILRLLNQSQISPETSQKIGLYDVKNILNICVIVNALERMADWAFKIAEEVTKIENTGVEISDDIKARIDDYYKGIKDVSDKAVKSMIVTDTELANASINLFEDSLAEQSYDLIDHLRLENIQHGFGELRQILMALHRIGENAVTIATTAINAIAIDKDKLEEKETPILKYRF